MLRRRLILGLVAALFALTALGGAPRAAAGPAAVSAEESGLTLERACTPDTFRPDEWVVMECNQRLTNNGESTLTDITLSIGGTYNGSIPGYFFVWSERDGEFQPVGTGALTFEGRDLEPGQTSVSTLVVLLRMSEGTFESEMSVLVSGEVALTRPFRFVAVAGAAEPPTDLLVTERLAEGAGSGEAQPTAVYETTITNQGSSPVTELIVTNRYTDEAVLVDAQPAPASRNDGVVLASWDLASFGKEALAPGESLVLRTTYGPGEGVECGYVIAGVVVEATVDGQERRYGARAEEGATLGECDYEEMPGGQGGGGGPVAFGRGGEGPAAAEGDVLWAAFVLAGSGVALVAAAMALRRRSRLGRRIYW